MALQRSKARRLLAQLHAIHHMPQAVEPEATKAMGDLRPTPGEKNEEGYPIRARIRFQGLPDIRIEQKKGQIRRGDGWQTKMPYDYGDFDETLGVDGDPVDVCVGPYPTAPFAYVVHQKVVVVDPKFPKAKPGDYDEDKVMVGFRTKAEAVTAFRQAYDRPGFLGDVTKMSIGELQVWLEDKKNRGKRIVRRQLEAAKSGGLSATWLLVDTETGREPCPDCDCYPCECSEAHKAMPEAMKWEV